MTILVAYASVLGSTREIAERIAAHLATMGEVECRSVEDIEGASGYEAVVIGSAIHNQKWLPAALLFVRRRSGDLAGARVWAFSVGMADGLPRPFRKRACALQQRRLPESLPPEIRLRGHKVFSGVYQASQMPPLLRGLFRVTGGRFGDLRDWQAIDGWVDQIIARLATPPSPNSPDRATG
ncbi:flavodoxin domain-containing protein [Arthrobacter sp. NPDC058192]|uniref:flavodoxin domain-containing protein n=1 Tax=Arthrobacter sp. NPDC058192 TaxID=3346372 RepID=UPI0036E5162B